MSAVDRLVCYGGARATLVARLGGERLVSVDVHPAGRDDRAGSILLARVERFAPELDAAFVDIGGGRGGFLRRQDMVGFDREPPPAGMPLLVQIVRDAVADKGARVTMNIGLAGRYLVFKPHEQDVAFSRRIAGEAERARLALAARSCGEEGGFTVRTAAVGAAADLVTREGLALIGRWDGMRSRALAASPPFVLHAEPHPVLRLQRDHGGELAEIVVDDRPLAIRLRQAIDSVGDHTVLRVVDPSEGSVLDVADVGGQIEAALAPRIVLPSGVELLFEPGRTLCAIDVDSGATTGRGARPARSPLEANLEAAVEIARQLRLRNIGGIVVVDFIDMRPQADRNRLQAALAAHVLDDIVATQVVGMTRLGLMEITRARLGPTLADALAAVGMAGEEHGVPDP